MGKSDKWKGTVKMGGMLDAKGKLMSLGSYIESREA
jgi:hypothetical protein